METRAITKLASLPDPEFFEQVSLGLRHTLINSLNLWRQVGGARAEKASGFQGTPLLPRNVHLYPSTKTSMVWASRVPSLPRATTPSLLVHYPTGGSECCRSGACRLPAVHPRRKW